MSSLFPSQASTPSAAVEIHKDFVNIIYDARPFNVYLDFINKWSRTEICYVNYVRTVWYKCITQWAVALCEVPLQGIHTNSFVESWHQNLKYNFMSRTKSPRPDKFLHGFVSDVEPSFRQAVYTTELGFSGQSTTKFQGIAKGQADLEAIGVHIFAVTSQLVRYVVLHCLSASGYLANAHVLQHHVNSLTRPRDFTYTVMSTPRQVGRVGKINSCTCFSFSQTHSACKHMYIIARRLGFNVKELVTVEVTPRQNQRAQVLPDEHEPGLSTRTTAVGESLTASETAPCRVIAGTPARGSDEQGGVDSQSTCKGGSSRGPLKTSRLADIDI